MAGGCPRKSARRLVAESPILCGVVTVAVPISFFSACSCEWRATKKRTGAQLRVSNTLINKRAGLGVMSRVGLLLQLKTAFVLGGERKTLLRLLSQLKWLFGLHTCPAVLIEEQCQCAISSLLSSPLLSSSVTLDNRQLNYFYPVLSLDCASHPKPHKHLDIFFQRSCSCTHPLTLLASAHPSFVASLSFFLC